LRIRFTFVSEPSRSNEQNCGTMGVAVSKGSITETHSKTAYHLPATTPGQRR
jgi:hypothetical protein